MKRLIPAWYAPAFFVAGLVSGSFIVPVIAGPSTLAECVGSRADRAATYEAAQMVWMECREKFPQH